MNCRISGKPCKEVFSLGPIAVSDFVTKQPENLEKPELKLMFCEESKLLQLSETVDPSKMYGKYWYRSGTNESMRAALKDIVDSILKLKKGDFNSAWLDCGSNDGFLLSCVPDTFVRVGIDPADNSFTKESEEHADHIIQSLFNKQAIEEYRKQKPRCPQQYDVITAIAMFYDLDNPIQFLKDIYDILEDDGLLVLQLSYTPLMIEQNDVGNIVHEHLCYYTLVSLENLLTKCGFLIRDVQLNEVNGGSFRIYIQKISCPENSFGTAPYRDVCHFRTESLREYERGYDCNKIETYQKFFNRIQGVKNNVVDAIKLFKSQGKSIWVLGASTKGNTILQWFGLDNKLISGACDRSEFKTGLKTIATDIPIYSESIMRAIRPDYLLVLPWHFINELKEREKEYLESGGHFLVPMPNFEIIGKD